MARREHHEEPEEAEAGMERWLLTYADMITLLLALFVVLFALSTISTKKFTALANALRDTFSGHTTVVCPENVLRSAVASAVNFFVLMVLRAKSTTKSANSSVIMSA